MPRNVDLLGARPERPYDEIGRIEARGRPGEQRSSVYQELRNKARALGADAVIELEGGFEGIAIRYRDPES